MRRSSALPLSLCLALAAPSSFTATAPAPLAWEIGQGFRRLPLSPTPVLDRAQPATGFTRLDPAALGIRWTNHCSPARYSKRQNLMNGAGVALGDFDGDGWCDIYLCNREGPNALYRNLGNWRFVDVASQAGVTANHLISSGALFADFNGDGRLDLHVTSFLGPDALFLNRGDGTFTNVTSVAGIASPGGGTSSAAADLDGDGDLDLYVARFAVEALLRDGGVIATRMVGGQPVATGRAGRRIKILDNKLYENGEPDLVFLNHGNGTFTPLDWLTRFRDESGQRLKEPPPDLGFTVQLRDIDGNGTPDIYVCNDFQTPDRIWLGDGHGQFRALPGTALRNMSYASMGVDFADIDRDGFLDFYALEMLPGDHFRHLTHLVRGADPAQRQPRNPLVRDAFSRSTLSWNRGDGTYAEIAWFAGVAASDWAWTPIFLDVDLDGYEDLLISSGYPHDVNHLDFAKGAGRGEGRRFDASFTAELLAYPPLDAPHIAWRNRGDRTFEDLSDAWRFNFRSVTHGLALADLDNDGDLDVVGNVFNGAPLVCRNDADAPRVAVRLKGTAPNTFGTGARIRILGGAVPLQELEMLSGGRYLSCDQNQRTFAVGPTLGALTLEVRWRDGRVSLLSGLRPNAIYEIDQAHAAPPRAPTSSPSSQPDRPLSPIPTSPPSPLFEAIPTPASLSSHSDPPFDEFQRQSLLPWRQSFQGPGLLWYDADGDGRDELRSSNGRGRRPASVRFAPPNAQPQPIVDPWGAALPDDGLGLLGVALQPGIRTLLLAVANYESGTTTTDHPAVLRVDFAGTTPTAGEPLPGVASGPGSLAAADIDSDGDVDVVVAGRTIAGRYPEPASTRVFRNDSGRLVDDAAASAPLAGVGLVTGVLLVDLDGDTRPELVLACEWGPLRVFRFANGIPQERTADLGLDRVRGIWQSVTAADLDGDGRLDLIAGNWGRNSHQQRAPSSPWQLHYADFDGDGRVTIVETFFHPDRREQVPFRTRDALASELRWLPAVFPLHTEFARAPLPQILGDHAHRFSVVEATTLDTTVFLNRGDRFAAQPLPAEAQWTPVLCIATADFDGDGDVDLFVAQNFFAVRDEDDRIDAGLGLLLLNDGQARFTPVSAADAGIRILGEQRGVAVGDFNADGRPDLAVGQNDGPIVLLANRTATPGVRVRIRGPGANPDGIGTRFRLEADGWQGPLHELRAGSGHLSQDSLVTILGGRAKAQRLWVNLPGREPRLLELPPRENEVIVSPD